MMNITIGIVLVKKISPWLSRCAYHLLCTRMCLLVPTFSIKSKMAALVSDDVTIDECVQ